MGRTLNKRTNTLPPVRRYTSYLIQITVISYNLKMHRSILALALFLQQGLAAYCPPTGTLLPLPQVSKDLDLSNLTSILDGIAANSSALGWNSTTTSFSIQATSLDETFFSHYHTAPEKNETGTQEVGGDTVFRIASVTKVFTVLALLLEKEMGLDDPIGKYVEELDGKEGWEDVTLRLLASQLAAVSRGGEYSPPTTSNLVYHSSTQLKERGS